MSCAQRKKGCRELTATNCADSAATNRPSILVIDDEESIRQLVLEALEGTGYRVRKATTGVEGLRQVRAQPIDLVITDIFMPDMDGLELVGVLHRDFPTLRIIAMSGGSKCLHYCDIAKKLGAHETLAKPFILSRLLEMVAHLLGTKT